MKAALSSSLISCEPAEIEALDTGDDSYRLSVVEEFQIYQRTWVAEGFGRAITLLIEKRGLAADIFEKTERKRQITDLRHLTELIQERAGKDLDDYELRKIGSEIEGLIKFLLQNGQLSYNPDCRVMNYSMGLPKTNEVL